MTRLLESGFAQNEKNTVHLLCSFSVVLLDLYSKFVFAIECNCIIDQLFSLSQYAG